MHTPVLKWLLVAGLISSAPAHAAEIRTATTVTTREQPVATEDIDAQLARDWGLRADEWARYRELMEGPLGTYSPNLDPLSALGIEARTDEERRRYAEMQVRAEAQRVEKLLAYQRAYDDAWARLHPGTQRVTLLDDARTSTTVRGSGRMAVFVRHDCEACGPLVRRLQSSGAEFDVYVVGSLGEDARIRDWAKRTQIDPIRVRSGSITLNHDQGRWLMLGVGGDLPAVVREVNGQWQRQP